uniref:Uncharacterized protein n=1 Tax=Knipowitschia caucasica TaxID=637954 RepID=A0AAV2KU44_KNICA
MWGLPGCGICRWTFRFLSVFHLSEDVTATFIEIVFKTQSVKMPRLKGYKRSRALKLRREKQLILSGKASRKCFVKLGLTLEKEQNCVKESVDTDFAAFQIPIEDENLEETQEETQLTVQSLLVHLEQTSEESPSEAKENHICTTQQEPLEETIEEVQKLEEPQEDTHLTVQCLVPLEQTSESPSDAQESPLFKVPELLFFPEDLDLFHETTA